MRQIENGARVEDVSAGNVVVLRLPLEPRITRPDSRIDAVRGTIAVERGPFVICAESVDLPGDLSVTELVVDADAGVEALGAGAVVRGRRLSAADAGWPYGGEAGAATGEALDVPLIPYHSWANRGPSTMRVWLPGS